jgi:hypothetical protein
MNLTIWTGIREYVSAEIKLAHARRDLHAATTDEEIAECAAKVRTLEEASTAMETLVRESL